MRSTLILMAFTVALAAPPCVAQNSGGSGVTLVLTPEFCKTEYKHGNGWTSVKDKFPIGEKFCPEIRKRIVEVFPGARVTESVPAAPDPQTRIVLVPKVEDIGATQKSLAFSKRELLVMLEWTATDAAQKTVWTRTIEASAKRNMGNAFTHGSNMKKINQDVIDDAVEKSLAELRAAKPLHPAN